MWLRIAQIGLLLLGLMASAATWTQAAPTPLPDNLNVPSAGVVVFKAHARGVQIYACAPRANDPSSFEWSLKAPEAELRNEDGEQIARHFAGPTWEANDGSRVIGEAVERANAPNPDAIPWLLLKATASEGTGLFSGVTYIQRLETVGGVAPIDGCDPSTAGAERRVPYEATYAFAYRAAR
jgi:hypothetical protein